MLRVGFAGLKGHQGVAVEGLRQLPEAQVVAVADDDPRALAAVAGWPAGGAQARAYQSWQEMLEREELDLLVEAGVDSERNQVLLTALARGLPVLAEKPLANSLAELTELRARMAASGVLVSMLLTMRFEPAYRLAREVILGGEIGEVCLATFQKSYRLGDRPAWQRSRKTFSGIIPFIGIHALDCMRWCTGREYVQVFGMCANVGHPQIGDMEDQGQVLCRLDNGGSASARLDYCRPATAPTHGDDRLRVAGNRGVLETLPNGAGVLLITAGSGPRELGLGPPPENQFVNFVRAMRGEVACEVSTHDCLRVTEVALQARESAREGAPRSV